MEPAGIARDPPERPVGRPVAASRRRLVSVAALVLAGGAASGRVTDRQARPSGGAGFQPPARRRRLRIALAEEHAAKIQPLLVRFEEEHDTAVQVTALPAPELFAMLAVELLHETQSVDVVSLSDDWIPGLGRTAVLVSGSSLVSDESAAAVHERVLGLGISLEDERLVAAPWTIDIGYTAVDGEALGMTTVPRRWDALAGLVERSGATSMALAGASGDVAAATFRAILSGFGTDIVEPTTNRPTLVDHEARSAIAVMRRLQALTSVLPLAINDRAIHDLLVQGAITSCVHVWASTWLEAGAPTGWTLLPPLRASAPRGSRLLRSWLFAIPRSALDVDLARTFVEWMLAPAAQRSLLDAGLVGSSRLVLGDRDEWTTRPTLEQFVLGLASASARPRLRSFPEINRVCGEAVAAILAGNASTGAAFRAANAEMRRILEREGELRL